MRSFLAVLAVLMIGTGLLWQATNGARAITAEGARRLLALEENPVMPSPVLTGMSGAPVRLKAGEGGVALVEFIYTTCPTICRAAGDSFAQIQRRVAEKGLASQVRLFSVSFDPAHDDADALSGYGKTHGADGVQWNVAVPAQEDLPDLLKRYGVTVIVDPFYGYEHNAAIHLIDDRGRLSGIFDIEDVDGVLEALRP